MIPTVKFLMGTAAFFAVSATSLPASTLVDWNKSNVLVGATPAPGVTGESIVYDRAPGLPGAVTNGRILFTPDEAVSPGIKVQPESYDASGPAPRLPLSGCLMTSNPAATCSSPFQSGKRIKQAMTGFGPLDLVFDVLSGNETNNYQVFHRLINDTASKLTGFTIELGFGVGGLFTRATGTEGLSFASGFRAPPSNPPEPAGSQFPFGLFGDAASNPNFEISGFFDIVSRAGLLVDYAGQALTSTGFFGSYDDRFGGWLPGQEAPAGAAWEYDPSLEALVMGWELDDGTWELRRDFAEGAPRTIDNIVSLTDATARLFASYDDLAAYLGLGTGLVPIEIEDLANLNVNFAIELGPNVSFSSFTLRTTVTPMPIPLPAGAPLLIGGLALLGVLRRSRARRAA